MSSYDQKKVANIIAVVGVFVFTFILSLKQIYNNDLWWHLKSGVWILEHGAIPYTDTFSFLTEGEPWYNLSWLSGVVLYSVYAFSGLDGLVIFKAVLIGAGFAIACQYLIRNNVNPFLAALIVGFAAVVAAFRFLLRPSFLLFFFVPILFWLCAKLKDHFQAISITLIFMTIVWINLHGGAFLAPVFVGFVVVEQFLNQYAFKRNNLDDAPQIKFFCFVLVLLSLSLFVTPFGVKPILATLERTLLSDLVFRSYSVQEHLPLQWGSHFNYWLLMIVTGLSCLINLRRIRLYYLLVFLAVSWLSLNSMRYVGFSALLHATVLGLNARDIQRYYLPGLKRLPIKIEYTLFLPGLILLSIFGFKSIFHANAIAKWGFGLNESKYPIEAVSFLKEVNYSGNLLNGWGEGGYILWFLPKANVSLDSRALDGQLDILEKWSRSTLGEFNQFLEDKEVSAALIQKKEALLTDYLNRSEKYRLAYFDDHYLVYLRNDVFDRAGIKASGTYKYIRPTQYDVSYLKNLAAESLARAVESEFQAAMQISGNNFMLLFHYAFYL
ncbi:MAG: hypothetical protein C0623_07510 [Desulfuromonas sp.]|nr:MAG: hypothetical protein C0623_07510 [Desulfuromonas sp.]